MALFKNYLQRLIEANAAADAEAGQSGASAAESSLCVASSVTPVDGSGVTWGTPIIVGSDLEKDGVNAARINVLTDGLYQVVFDVTITQSADADGSVAPGLMGTFTAETAPFVDFGNNSWYIPVRPCAGDAEARGIEQVLMLPPARLGAGVKIGLGLQPHLFAGSVTASAVRLYIVRLA